MRRIFVVLAVMCLLRTVHGAGYRQVCSFENMQSGFPCSYVYSALSYNNVVYSQLYGTSMSGITATSSVDGQVNTDVLMDPVEWNTVSGGSYKMNAYSIMCTDGTYLYYAELDSDQIYKTNMYDGTTTIIGSKSAILDATGLSVESLLSYGDEYNGEYYFFEAQSRSILKAGEDGVDVYLSKTELESITDVGTSTVSGGMSFDDEGNLYWGSNASYSIYVWDGSGCEVVVSGSEIAEYTGQNVLSLGDIYFAPDGTLYFKDNGYGILRYVFGTDGSDGVIETVLTNLELLAGDADSQYVYNFDWYDGQLAFTEKTSGYFVVPEPATMILAAAGGFVLARRKKS